MTHAPWMDCLAARQTIRDILTRTALIITVDRIFIGGQDWQHHLNVWSLESWYAIPSISIGPPTIAP